MIDNTTFESQLTEITRLERETAVNDYRLALLPRLRKIDKHLDQMGVGLQKAGISFDDPVWDLHDKVQEEVKQLILSNVNTGGSDGWTEK